MKMITWVVSGGVILVGIFLGLRYALQRSIRGNLVAGFRVPAAKDVRGKRALVVGGTNGLGLAIAKALSSRGAIVTVVGRSKPNDDSVAFLKADLSTVRAQTQLADAVPEPQTLDYVIFTQGILAPAQREQNDEGIEIDLAISSLGRKVILDRLIERAKPLKARVFIMGFCGAEQTLTGDLNGSLNYQQWPQHMNTIVANDAIILGHRKRGFKNIFGLNPGLIRTGIRSNVYGGKAWLETVIESIIGLLSPTAAQYGESILSVITGDVDPAKAVFFNQFGEAVQVSSYLSNEKNQDFVWDELEKLTKTARGKN